MRKIFLNGGWTLTDGAIDGTLSATVPGCLHTDLIRAGLIKDIYYRDNAEKYAWVENCSPIYETRFDAELSGNVRLKFEGLDTFASVYLNGVHLGDAHNMFIPHSFDVGSLLNERDNVLRVEFTSPIAAVEGMPEAKGFAFTGDRMRARRMQCTYGWDWVYRFVTMGIYRPVYLEYREGLEVEDVYVRTDATDSFGASLSVELEFSGVDSPGLVTLEIISPAGECIVADRFYVDQSSMVRHYDIADPELWYPAGYGRQPIYTAVVRTDSSEFKRSFGIRTFRILCIPDKKGSEYYNKALAAKNTPHGSRYCADDSFFGFQIVVNGVNVYAKGGNWVPCSPFPSEETDGRIREILHSAKDMGANIVRVWGGGLLEREIFYDECDRLGLLVVHDFMMACGQYPEDEEWFIDELRLESEHAVRTLRSHPSLAWLHGDNENATDDSDIASDYIGRRSAMMGIYPSVRRLAPNVPFLASSPWGGNKFASITSGTAHNTNYLYDILTYFEKTDCSDYKEFLSQFTSRFMSEEATFGAVCRASMLEFLAEEDLADDGENMLVFHTRTNPHLPRHLYEYMRDMAREVLGEFTDAEDRLFKYRYIQCEWLRLTAELAMSNIGYNGGVIYWMLNDCWPASAGWSLIDYYVRRKPAYYAFRRASRPAVGAFSADGRSITVSCPRAESSVTDVFVRSAYSAELLLDTSVMPDAYSSVTLPIDFDNLNEPLVLDVVADGEVYRTFYKKGRLEVVREDAFEIVSLTDRALTLRALKYLQAVEIEGDADLSDNYFVMLEGETKTVNIEKYGKKFDTLTVKSYTLK